MSKNELHLLAQCAKYWKVIQLSMLRAALCILVLITTACGSDTSTATDVTEDPVPVPTRVTASESAVSFSAIGEMKQLSAVVEDQAGTVHPEWSIRWESASDVIATVSTSGLVEAVANGSTEVTATSGSASDTISISVAQVVASLSFSSDSVVLGGPSDTVTVQITPLDSGGSPVEAIETWWSSDDPDVVRTLGNDLFLAEAVGTTSLVAHATTGADTVSATVPATVETPPVLQPDQSCRDYPFYAVPTFEDSALEAAVRVELNLAPEENLTCAVLSQMTDLTAWSAGITSLVGLHNAERLIRLSLKSNSVSNIGPVSQLASLQVLDLQSNPVADISSVGGLLNLTRLDVQGGTFSDVSALSGHPSLERLLLSGVPVQDLTPLDGLTTLRNLGLSLTSVVDIGPVGSLSNLTRLDLSNTDVTDLSPLSGATSLQVLHLRNMELADVSPLANLVELEFLAISNSLVTDISALAGLTNLQDLQAGSNSIVDIQSLAGLTGLTRLELGQNSITDVTPLGGLTALEDLQLWANPGLADIDPLLENAGLGAGDVVSLGQTSVSCTDVAALEAKGVNVLSDCQQ